jgi:DNA-binding NtrC family response regulator
VSDTFSGPEESIPFSDRRAPLALEVLHSPDVKVVGTRAVLGRAHTLFVGREAPGGLTVADTRMSKEHLLIVCARGTIECADSGSTNGTFVNGLQIKRSVLRHGDVIRAGNTLFAISTEDPMRDLGDRAAAAANSLLPVLLLGETGTGKEVCARSIHERSGRRGPFVPLNCATLPRDLVSAELFGHVRGAFSGAQGARLGLFRAAEGGTLFLDEIGDLPLDLQPSLLRALEERKVRPIGAEQEIPVDVRVIAATHVDLEAQVARERFRADLFARLAHVVLRIPPLRERRAEILKLAREFSPKLRFSTNAAEALLLSPFPFNVRELRALVEASALYAKADGAVRLRDIEDRIPAAASVVRKRSGTLPSKEPDAAPHPLAERREKLLSLFQTHGGNVSKVASELGKPRAQVYRWLRALGLDAKDFRKE